MTNGEKIKEIFPNLRITVCEFYVQVMGEQYEFSNTYPLKWWNAEYKKPNKSESPTGSNTKNDLGVGFDCISRFSAKQIIRNHYCSIPSKAFKKLIEELDSLSPVTPIRPKGHWIKEKSVHGWDGYSYQCSACGRSVHLDTAVEDINLDYPYCHCGVKMEGVEE